MTDIQLKDYGIKIVEDGTLHKKYRRYLYKGIELGLTHGQVLYMHTGRLSEIIFEAGKEKMRLEFKKLLQCNGGDRDDECDQDIPD